MAKSQPSSRQASPKVSWAGSELGPQDQAIRTEYHNQGNWSWWQSESYFNHCSFSSTEIFSEKFKSGQYTNWTKSSVGCSLCLLLRKDFSLNNSKSHRKNKQKRPRSLPLIAQHDVILEHWVFLSATAGKRMHWTWQAAGS